MSGCDASGSSGPASGGPSTSTASGFSSSSARSTLRAEPGPWWRMPRMLTLTVLPAQAVGAPPARSTHQLAAGAVEVVPALALPGDRLQVFLPDGAILDGVLDHRAGQPGRDVGGGHVAVAEVSGQCPAVRHHRDRLSGRERRRWALELRRAVLGLAVSQLAEDRHHTADLIDGRRGSGPLEGASQLVDPAP